MRSHSVASILLGCVVATLATPAAAALVPAGVTVLNEMTPNGLIDEGEGLAVQFCIRNTDPTPTPPFLATLLARGGVETTPSSRSSYGSLAAGETACRTYALRVMTTCGTPPKVLFELTFTDPGPSLQSSMEFDLPFPLSPWSETFESASGPGPAPDWTFAFPWSIDTVTSDTAPNAAFVPSSNNLDASLTSSAILLPAGSWTLQFRHAYAIEAFWDGAVLEMAIGAGPFQDVIAAGGVFTGGGYNNANVQGGPLIGRPGWSGDSGGFITTRVLLPPAVANQAIRLRWRHGTDGSVLGVGWRVDSVAITAQNCSAVPQSMPWGLRAAVHGNQVRFQWRPVLSQQTATYRLEVSLDGGSVYQLAIPVGDTTSFTAQGPDVVAHARVRAVLAGGVLGPPGQPVVVSLGSTAPPATPRPLLATTDGTTVHLTWALDEPGGSSTAVILEAGDAPGLANLARIPLPPGTTTFSAGGVPPGVYYVRVRQQGPVLGSGPSQEVQVSLPGTCQAPSRPSPPDTSLLVYAGNLLTIEWGLGGVGTPAPTGWHVVARDAISQAVLGSVVVNQRRIVTPIPKGGYTIDVFAVNPCGTSPALRSEIGIF